MNLEHLTSLKQAAELIKLGKTKPARGLIIEVLRDDPNNSQAWFMLSFAVPNVDKQIYALQQTIRLVPDHEKAIDRIKKLGGNLPHSSSGSPSVDPSITSGDTPLSQKVADTPEADLLSQRLFGEKPSPKETPMPEKDKISKPPVFYHEIAEQAGSESSDQEIDDSQDLHLEEDDQKVFGFPRKYFLIGIGIVIIALAAILGFSPKLIDLIKSSSPAQQAGITTLESQLQATETNPPQPTPTAILSTPTTVPTATPIILNIFSTSDLLPVTEDGLTQLKVIETGIQTLLDVSITSNPTIYKITDPRLQTFIWDFAKFEGFGDQIKENQKIFEILGLAEPGNDFSSFYQNIWVDPNGTLFLPDKNFIAIVGLDFSEFQKYSYAQAYIQSIRNQQFSYETLNFYPPCLGFSQECDIRFALAKGEPAFTAWQWVLETFDEQEVNKIDQTTRKLYFAPVASPPSVMEAIRLFPYEQGFKFVEGVFEQGGWENVQSLYENIPTTTEQILHPEKYITGEVGTAIDSTELSNFLTTDWQPIFQGALGEWKTFLILTAGANPTTHLTDEEAQQATDGWNGDYTQIFTTNTGKSLITAHWKFDTMTDTAEFINLFSQYTEKRFGSESVKVRDIDCIRNGVQISCLTSRDEDVIWLVGPDSQTMDLVLENYTLLQTD